MPHYGCAQGQSWTVKSKILLAAVPALAEGGGMAVDPVLEGSTEDEQAVAIDDHSGPRPTWVA